MTGPAASTPDAAAGVPDPQFTVLSAEAVPFAAAPTMRFTAHVSEPEGREVFTIALSVQIRFEPAKRSYDDEARERLVELFGEPERWAATTQNFLWTERDVLVPAFTGATAFTIPVPCTYDLEVASAKYLHALDDGTVPLQFNFTGTIFYRADAGRLQMVKVPWDCSARFALPIATWRAMMAEHYPNGAWVRVSDTTLAALGARKARRGQHSYDATVAELLEGRS